MKQPITWKNVDAPNFTSAGVLQKLAQQSAESAFSSAEALAKGFADRKQRGVDLNTQDFTDRVLKQYQSPEELQAARDSGELDALRGRYSQLNREKTGAAAINEMITGAETRAASAQTHADATGDVNDRQYRAQIAGLRAQGNNEGANRLTQEFLDAGKLTDKGASASFSLTGLEVDKDAINDANIRNVDSQIADRDADNALAKKQYGLNLRESDQKAELFARQTALHTRTEWDRSINAHIETNTPESLAQAEALVEGSSDPAATMAKIRAAKVNLGKSKITHSLTGELQGTKAGNTAAADYLDTIKGNNPGVAAMLEDRSLRSTATKSQLALLGGMQTLQEKMFKGEYDEAKVLPEVAEKIVALNAEAGKTLSMTDATKEAQTMLQQARSSLQVTPQQQIMLDNQQANIDKLKEFNSYATDGLANYTHGEKMNAVFDMMGFSDMTDRQGKLQGLLGKDWDDFMATVNRGTIEVERADGTRAEVPLTLPTLKYMAGASTKGWIFTTSPRKRATQLAEAGYFDEKELDDYATILEEEDKLEDVKRGINSPQFRRDGHLAGIDVKQRQANLPMETVTTEVAKQLLTADGKPTGNATMNENIAGMNRIKEALTKNNDVISPEARQRATQHYMTLSREAETYTDETRALRTRIENLKVQKARFEEGGPEARRNVLRVTDLIADAEKEMAQRLSKL